nr:hypothetical protein [Candidatus Sigynarchaeota archaeon]
MAGNKINQGLILALCSMMLVSGIMSVINKDSGRTMVSDMDQVLYNPPSPSGTTLLNLSYYAIGDVALSPIALTRGTMYNITFSSTGNASFDTVIANKISVHDPIAQETTVDYDDELLIISAVPLWGTYDSWDVIALEDYSRIRLGISLGSGTTRSIMVYIAGNYPLQNIECAFLVGLKATSNPGNNLISITWDTVSLTSPAMTVNQSRTNSFTSGLFNASSSSILNLASEGGLDLTTAFLNQTLSANGSLTLVYWQKDMSGTFIRRTAPVASGINSEIFVPWFKNARIDGATQPAIVINTNVGSTVQLN